MKIIDLFESKSNILDLNRISSKDFKENREMILSELDAHCRPWLDAVGAENTKAYLKNWKDHYYRGATVNTRKEWIKPVRQDRKPLDTPEMIHEFIQDVYRKNGIAANRGNSAFITREESVAQSYGTGTAYVVMAVGDFQTSMLQGVRDFYSLLNGIVTSVLARKYNIYGVKEFVVKMNTIEEADVQTVFSEIERYISDHIVNNPDLSAQRGSDSEILLNADYIAYFSRWMIEDLAYFY